MTKEEITDILACDDPQKIAEVYRHAYQVKQENVGRKVYYRGIIEFSNICTKNCFYCGIRKDNTSVPRFCMSEDEIVETALFADEAGYGSLVLQSGERGDPAFIDFVTHLVHTIKTKSIGRLGITLSLGEQEKETFQRWFDAGAHRYLLRIETSNSTLYRRLHPQDHFYARRLQCLDELKEIGYQVGTGVMIGLPHQTFDDLAEDILFYTARDIDMIGMGPYIVHQNTPMAAVGGYDPAHNFQMGLKMIALTRLHLKDVNIAATTALQALDPQGRELGLQAGANIIMPNITPVQYRDRYQLYENKPCLDENAAQCRGCLAARIGSIGEEIGYHEWGDSPHFFKRKSSSLT